SWLSQLYAQSDYFGVGQRPATYRIYTLSMRTCGRIIRNGLVCFVYGVNAPPMPNYSLKSVNTLRVHDILEPYKWLQCIQWTRYQRQGQKVSMEWFIARPNNSDFIILGRRRILAGISRKYMEMIQIHPERTCNSRFFLTFAQDHTPANRLAI
ncbi:hypothetical protein TNCT_647041, partial [Trichonephila clavata]